MWTVYTIHVKPGQLRDPERFAPGTLLRIVDPVTGAQLPPDGTDVRITSREIERYWSRHERAGDVEITATEEPTPWEQPKPKRRRRTKKAPARTSTVAPSSAPSDEPNDLPSNEPATTPDEEVTP
jgi:hypothetical protein